MSEAIGVETGLKQDNTLFSLLFNIAIGKVVRTLKNEIRGMNVDQYQIKVLAFADDLNTLGDSLGDTVRATKELELAA